MTRISAITPRRGGVDRRQFAAGAAALGLVSRPAIAATKLKIGLILPMSGYLAEIGQDDKRGEVLAGRVLPGMGYEPFEVVVGDTESKPEIARAVAEKLVNDGCHILIGAFDSGQTIAAVQVAEQKGIPFIVHIGAAPQITESGYKWVVRNFPTIPMILDDSFLNQKALFDYTKTAPKTVVLLHTNDTYGTIIAKGTPDLVAKHNMPYKLLDAIAYDPTAKDLSLEVAKAKASGAEALITVSRVNDAMLITREMVKQRWNPMGVMTPGPGWSDRPYLQTMGKMGDDVLSLLPWFDPNTPLSKRLVEEQAKVEPDRQLHVNHVLTFEAIYIAVDALKRAGTTEPNALKKALRETHIVDNSSISPAIAFDAKGQNTGIKNACVQNKGGLLKVVIPRSAADAEPVWPMRPWDKRA